MASRLHVIYSCNSSAHARKNFSAKRPEVTKSIHSHDVIMKPSNFKMTSNTERRTNTPKAKIRLQNLSLARNLLSHLDSGSLDVALTVFDNMIKRDTFIWNVLIRGLTDNQFFQEILVFYKKMQMEGVKPDNYTFPFVIKASSVLLDVIEGQKIHCKIIKMGLERDVYICNALIIMYSRFDLIELAENLFHNMDFKDIVSWNSMISGYCSTGDSFSSLKCFHEMQTMGVTPDRFSIIGVLGAISLPGGKEVHCQVIKRRFESDPMIKTSLVDMYGKFGQVDYAERVFNRTSSRNVALWNAMIQTYALNEKPIESLNCFNRMKECDDLEPDVVTFINLISSCTRMNALLQAKSIHAFATRKGLFPHTVLETALVDLYGKSCVLDYAHQMFDKIQKKNLVSWNVMISAFVQNGHEKEALKLFLDLRNGSLSADEITFANILPAYAEIALPKEGQQIHGMITKLGYVFSNVISNALIYMYGKCGDIESAKKIFNCMLNKDLVTWNTVIMAHAIHGLGQDALKLFDEMLNLNLKPNGSTFVSLLTSCTNSGLVDEGQIFFDLMKKEYDIDPTIEHYGCMIDLIGRIGDLEKAKQFIDQIPYPLPLTARIWGSLLTASRNHKNTQVAEFATNKILSLENDNTGCYILLSNMYAEEGKWDDVARIRSNMTNHGFQKTIARSTIESGCKTYEFTNYDHSKGEFYEDVLDIISRKIGEDMYCQRRNHHVLPEKIKRERSNSPMWHSVRLAICFGLINTRIRNAVIVRKNVRICEDCHEAAKKISYITKREIMVGDSKMYHHFRNGQCSCKDYW